MTKYEVYYSEALDQYLITARGPMGSGQVVLTHDQYLRFKAWQTGPKMIQDALPDLSADDREILMTGIGPEQWDRMFKTEED